MAAQSTKSLAFDGTGYVSANTGTVSATNLATMSVSLWVKVSGSGSGGNRYVLSRRRTSDGAGYAVYYHSDDGTVGVFVGDGSTSVIAQSNSTVLSLNTWYHIGFTYDGSSLTVYVNGAVDGTGSGAATPNVTPSSGVVLGCYNNLDTGGFGLLGSVDDVAVFSGQLTSGQFAAIAGTPGVAGSSSLDVATLSPVGLWRIEEGTGTTTADTSGNGNDGTFTGGVSWSSSVPTPLQAGSSGSVGTVAGTGAAAGVGASLAAAVGAAAGTSTAAAVGKSLAAAVGASSGTGTAAAVGASLAAATSTVSGAAAASAVGASLAAAAGAADGVATVAGFSPGASTGSAAGTCTVAGAGASLAAAAGTATGACTVVGIAPGGVVTVAGPYYFVTAAWYVSGANAGLVYAAGASAGQITTE